MAAKRFRKSYLTGRGIIQMRARAGIDRIGRGTQERDAIVITEIPFQVNKARLIERIAELINEKKLEGISDLRDESDRSGMRIVVELKRDAVPQVVLNKLYKLTPMQSSFGVINLAIVNGQPRVLNLKQMLECFVDFRREVVRRRTEYELRKARARAHILEGLTKAIDALDYIVTLIRNSRSVDEARQWLTGQTEDDERSENLEGRSVGCARSRPICQSCRRRWSGWRFPRFRRRRFSICNCAACRRSSGRRSSTSTKAIIKLIAELEEILANESSLRRVIGEGTRRSQERVWRRAADRNHRRRRRVLNRRSDCRRRRGDHRHQQRLHQTHADHHLSAAGTRRQGTVWRRGQERRLTSSISSSLRRTPT